MTLERNIESAVRNKTKEIITVVGSHEKLCILLFTIRKFTLLRDHLA